MKYVSVFMHSLFLAATITGLTACNNDISSQATVAETSTVNTPATTIAVPSTAPTPESTPVATYPVAENNGGSVVQYGNDVYFMAPNEKDPDMNMAIYVLHPNEPFENKEQIFQLHRTWTTPFYIADHTLIVEDNTDRNQIFAIPLDTKIPRLLADGELNTVDTETNEIFYSYLDFSDDQEEQGLFKIKMDGSNRTKLCPADYTFVALEGDQLYVNTLVDNYTRLARIHRDGSGLTTIADIPFVGPESEVSSDVSQHIVDFGICDGWIIASVGDYQGTGHFFYGGLIHMTMDGQQLQPLGSADIDSFYILDGWIYFNSWDGESNENGCYRIRPDGSGKEYMGAEIPYMNALSNKGFLYYPSKTSDNKDVIIKDLRQYTLSTKASILLFDGSTAPLFTDSDYVGYDNIECVGDQVYFGLNIHGYCQQDSWRGHTCYYAYYRVHTDGTQLERLYVDPTKHCPSKSN